MTDNNKEIDKLGADYDDDPTAELEVLSGTVVAVTEATGGDEPTPDIAGHDTQLGDADEAVVGVESGFKSSTETVRVLQFDIEQPESGHGVFEKEVRDLKVLISNFMEELKLAHEKQFHTSEMLKKRDTEIESLRSKLSGKEQTLIEFARQIEDAKNEEQASEFVDSNPAIINHYEQDVRELRNTSSTDTPAVDAKEESHELALLVPLNGKASSEHPIGTGRLSLGSSPDNDIRIKSEFISRHHAQIVSSSTNSILRDLNSTNGTYVNSKRIKRHALRNGDSITIGRNRFKYVEQNPGSSDIRKAALKEHT